MLYGQVYTDFLLQCQPKQSPAAWGRFVKNSDLRTPPKDEKATLTALREKHSDKDLIRSGVASRDGTKKLVLNPIFFGLVDNCILPLRAISQCHPFDLLTDEGTASGQLPIYATAYDHHVGKGINKRGILYVTFSMPDLMSLRAVGMPATLAFGLEQINRRSLKEFCGTLGLAGSSPPAQAAHEFATQPPPPAALPQEQDSDAVQASGSCDPSKAMTAWEHAPIDRPRLILVGWTPSQLSRQRPGNLDRVVRSITNIGSCLGVDLDEVFVWQPTVAEIRRIGFCLLKGNRKSVQKAILETLDQSAKPIRPPQNKKVSSGDILEARACLREALLRSGSSAEYRARRLREYQEAVDSTFVKPVLQQAAEESDPDVRSRLGGLAAINRLLHPSVELYSAKLEKEIAKNGLRGHGEGLNTRELMKMFDVLYRLTAED